jgi:hypothetical protein
MAIRHEPLAFLEQHLNQAPLRRPVCTPQHTGLPIACLYEYSTHSSNVENDTTMPNHHAIEGAAAGHGYGAWNRVEDRFIPSSRLERVATPVGKTKLRDDKTDLQDP